MLADRTAGLPDNKIHPFANETALIFAGFRFTLLAPSMAVRTLREAISNSAVTRITGIQQRSLG
jgi:hypothetical protein